MYAILHSFHFWNVVASSRSRTALKSALDMMRSKRMWSALESFIREVRRMKGPTTRVLRLMLPVMAHAI